MGDYELIHEGSDDDELKREIVRQFWEKRRERQEEETPSFPVNMSPITPLSHLREIGRTMENLSLMETIREEIRSCPDTDESTIVEHYEEGIIFKRRVYRRISVYRRRRER